MNQQQRAVIEQALEALELNLGYGPDKTIEQTHKAIEVLRQLLEQEPVFCEYCGGNDDADFGLPTDHCTDCARPQPAQPAPVQEPVAWVDIREIDIMVEAKHWRNPEAFINGAKWAQVELKGKNT